MFEHELNVYAFSLGYIQRLTEELSDQDLCEPPAPGANPPVWILAHLAVVSDFALQTLGRPTVCPPAWHQQFGPKSDPAKMTKPYPTKAELMATLERVHSEVTAAARTADPAAMARPHGIAMLDGTPIRTVGDALTLVMTTHEGVHIGQLSLSRRLRGRPPLF
jgi:hypothetical protein